MLSRPERIAGAFRRLREPARTVDRDVSRSRRSEAVERRVSAPSVEQGSAGSERAAGMADERSAGRDEDEARRGR